MSYHKARRTVEQPGYHIRPKYDLVNGTIYINQADTTDRLVFNLDPSKDTSLDVAFQAAIADQPSAYNTTVTFGVDTTQMSAYVQEYGQADLLPAGDYQLIDSVASMPAGAQQSSTVKIRLLSTARVDPFKTYVVPVVIKNVGGKTAPIRGNAVLFIVFTKVPDPNAFSVVSSTSDDGSNLASNILNGNYTCWRTPFFTTDSLPPQSVVVDLAAPWPINGITFRGGPNSFFAGAPTRVEIDLSTDGTTWTDAGQFNFTGVSQAVISVISFPTTTARYFRFTILDATSYAGYVFAELSDVGITY